MEIVLSVLIFVVGFILFYLNRKCSDYKKELSNQTKIKDKLELHVSHLNQEIGGLHEKVDTFAHQYEQKNVEISKINEQLEEEVNKNKKIISQKKSSETRLGLITEQISPFLVNFPYNPKHVHFFGQPIDFIVFDYDQGEIIFLEVKSGNSKESTRQRTIKNIIKSGNIFYEQMRVNEKGVKIKREPNNA